MYIYKHSQSKSAQQHRPHTRLIPEAEVSYNYGQKLLASHGSAVKTVSHT